jgi:hypothetical protein
MADWTVPGLHRALALGGIITAGGTAFAIAALLLGGPEVSSLRRAVRARLRF